MSLRFNYQEVNPEALNAMIKLEQFNGKAGLDKSDFNRHVS